MKPVSSLLFFHLAVLMLSGLSGCNTGEDIAGSTNTGNARVTASVYHKGRPVSGARVYLRDEEYLALPNTPIAPGARIDSTTNDSGKLVLVPNKAGRYTLEVTDDAGNGGVRSSISVPEGDTLIDLGRIDLERCGELEITVRTDHLDSTTSIHAGIYGMERSAHARFDGTVWFRNLPSGNYRIYLTSDRPETTGSTDLETYIAEGQTRSVDSVSFPIDYRHDSVLVASVLQQMGIGEEAWEKTVLRVENRIRELNLSRRNITVLPPSIGTLNFLWGLNIEANPLSSLPEEFGELTRLEDLDLDTTMFDSIPDVIGRCGSLRSLSVNAVGFSYLSDSLKNCDNLTALRIGSNNLGELPRVVYELTNLRVFSAEDNGLDSIRWDFGNLTRLSNLYLGRNRLSSLPGTFDRLQNLSYFSIGRNRFTEFPEVITKLTNLYELFAYENEYTTIPENISNCSRLTMLYVQNSELTDLPLSITQLDISRLLIDGNRLCNVTPEVEKWIDARVDDDWRSSQRGCE